MESFQATHMCWIIILSPMNSTTVSMPIAQNFYLQQMFPTTKFKGHKYNSKLHSSSRYCILKLDFKTSKVELTTSFSTLLLPYFVKLTKWHNYFLCFAQTRKLKRFFIFPHFIALHLVGKWSWLIYISTIEKYFLLSIPLTNHLSSFFLWYFFLCSRLISDHTISNHTFLISLSSLWLE